jgi:homoaconitase/3-isopropylmalate dehydratase large subunit
MKELAQKSRVSACVLRGCEVVKPECAMCMGKRQDIKLHESVIC